MPAHAAIVNVNAGMTAAQIQTAMDTANPGDEIVFSAGTYALNAPLTVNQQLTLTGAGPTTIIQPVSVLGAGQYDLKILASGTVVRNFFFDFNGAADNRAGTGSPSTGIVVSDFGLPPVTNVQIINNVIHSAHGHTALQTGKNSDVSGLLISGNTFYCDADGLGEAVYINPYPGAGPVTITNNTITGFIYAGISIEAANVYVANNTINSDAAKGLRAGIRIIDLTGGQAYGGITLLQNNITNMTYGISVGNAAAIGSALTVTMQNNTLTGNDHGIYLNTGTNNPTIDSNNIYGNTLSGLNNLINTPINAANNWWGSATGPTHAGNPGGTGDVILETFAGTVTYGPWLTAAWAPPAAGTTGSETHGAGGGGCFIGAASDDGTPSTDGPLNVGR